MLPHFYSFKSLALIGGRSALAAIAVAIYLICLAVFAANYLFYINSSQDFTERIVVAKSMPGYECQPLQKDPHYDVLMSYEECLAKVQPLVDTTAADLLFIWNRPMGGSLLGNFLWDTTHLAGIFLGIFPGIRQGIVATRYFAR